MRKHAASDFMRRFVPLLAVAILLASTHAAPATAQDAEANPLLPVDTSSPRATFNSFRTDLEKAYRAWREREHLGEVRALGDRVLRTMDMGQIGEAFRDEVGTTDALFLYDTLAKVGTPPLESIPDAQAVAAQGLTEWTFPGTEIKIVKMATGEQAGQFLFSAESVSRAGRFYDLVEHLPSPPGFVDVVGTRRASPGLLMPDALARRVWDLPPAAFALFLDEPLWKWIASLLSTLIVGIVIWLLWRVGRKWDRRWRKRESEWRVGMPLAMLLGIVLLVALDNWLTNAILLRDAQMVALQAVLTTLRYAMLAWLIAAVIAGIGNLMIQSFAANRRGLDAALIRLCFRILSIVAALSVVLYAAGQLGVSITPIIAGLGVGGLAVALAIRPTLENVVGGFVLFGDKPVRVGEFCSFGSMMGTVEEIGLRSTRLRGLDRTVITVPNAEFAQMQIVNFTRRDMNLFQCKLGLRYETTPDQLRFVAAKIKKLLIQHSKVSPDPARVRFDTFGDSAYILDVFAFVVSADWNEFMAVKEDLNFRIAEIVREAGTGFAFPSQTVYLTRDRGIDAARGAETEAEVDQWREEKRLPFPNYDFAEQAELEGTIPFPPEGSPDYRPTAPGDSEPLRKPQRAKGRWHELFRPRRNPTPAETP